MAQENETLQIASLLNNSKVIQMKLAYCGEKKHFSKSENITFNIFKRGDTLQIEILS